METEYLFVTCKIYGVSLLFASVGLLICYKRDKMRITAKSWNMLS